MIDLPVAEIVQRYEAGENGHALGRVYAVDYGTILHRLRAAGVVIRQGPRPFGGPLHLATGYLRTLDRDGKLSRVHRACWETHEGPIPDGHIVHHMNEDRLDNRIENLACMSLADHVRLHRPRWGTGGAL